MMIGAEGCRQSPWRGAMVSGAQAICPADQNLLISRSAANCASASDAKSSGVTTLTTVSPPALPVRALGKMAARQCPGLRRYVTIENSETFAIDRLGGQILANLGAMSTGLLTVAGRLTHAFDRRGRCQNEDVMRWRGLFDSLMSFRQT
jgi:hypothetical protein